MAAPPQPRAPYAYRQLRTEEKGCHFHEGFVKFANHHRLQYDIVGGLAGDVFYFHPKYNDPYSLVEADMSEYTTYAPDKCSLQENDVYMQMDTIDMWLAQLIEIHGRHESKTMKRLDGGDYNLPTYEQVERMIESERAMLKAKSQRLQRSVPAVSTAPSMISAADGENLIEVPAIAKYGWLPPPVPRVLDGDLSMSELLNRTAQDGFPQLLERQTGCELPPCWKTAGMHNCLPVGETTWQNVDKDIAIRPKPVRRRNRSSSPHRLGKTNLHRLVGAQLLYGRVPLPGVTKTIPTERMTDPQKRKTKRMIAAMYRDVVDYAAVRFGGMIRQRRKRARDREYDWDPVNLCEVRPLEDRKRLGRPPLAHKIMEAKKFKHAGEGTESDTSTEKVPDVQSLDKLVHSTEYDKMSKDELKMALVNQDKKVKDVTKSKDALTEQQKVLRKQVQEGKRVAIAKRALEKKLQEKEDSLIQATGMIQSLQYSAVKRKPEKPDPFERATRDMCKLRRARQNNPKLIKKTPHLKGLPKKLAVNEKDAKYATSCSSSASDERHDVLPAEATAEELKNMKTLRRTRENRRFSAKTFVKRRTKTHRKPRYRHEQQDDQAKAESYYTDESGEYVLGRSVSSISSIADYKSVEDDDEIGQGGEELGFTVLDVGFGGYGFKDNGAGCSAKDDMAASRSGSSRDTSMFSHSSSSSCSVAKDERNLPNIPTTTEKQKVESYLMSLPTEESRQDSGQEAENVRALNTCYSNPTPGSEDPEGGRCVTSAPTDTKPVRRLSTTRQPVYVPKKKLTSNERTVLLFRMHIDPEIDRKVSLGIRPAHFVERIKLKDQVADLEKEVDNATQAANSAENVVFAKESKVKDQQAAVLQCEQEIEALLNAADGTDVTQQQAAMNHLEKLRNGLSGATTNKRNAELHLAKLMYDLNQKTKSLEHAQSVLDANTEKLKLENLIP